MEKRVVEEDFIYEIVARGKEEIRGTNNVVIYFTDRKFKGGLVDKRRSSICISFLLRPSRIRRERRISQRSN